VGADPPLIQSASQLKIQYQNQLQSQVAVRAGPARGCAVENGWPGPWSAPASLLWRGTGVCLSPIEGARL